MLPLSGLHSHITGSIEVGHKVNHSAGSSHGGNADKSSVGSQRGASLADAAEGSESVESTAPDGFAPSWKTKFKLVERSGTIKDKKAKAKEHNSYQRRVEMFLEDVVGVSVSSAKHMPVVASDLPFKCLRGLGSIMSDMLPHNGQDLALADLQTFLDLNGSHRRAIKALLTEINGLQEEGARVSGTSHIYLYSTVDDRYDMVEYNPSCLRECVIGISNVPISPNRGASGKGKSR